MNEQQMLLGAIGAQWLAIGGMAIYIVSMHKQHGKEKDANIRMVVEAAMKMTASLDANTKTLDMISGKL